MKKLVAMVLVILLVLGGFVACKTEEKPEDAEKTPEPVEQQEEQKEEPKEEPEKPVEEKEPEIEQTIILATTTSTEDSGLLEYILPLFTKDSKVGVDVISVGTGAAIKMGEDGEADVILVHDTISEEKFVEEGHSDQRRDVMYNDYVLVGPQGDPDGIAIAYKGNIAGAMEAIAQGENARFISRGDDSGTHKKESRLWKEAAVTELVGEWYISVGKGMGDTLQMASEELGYTISDRATYLKMQDKLDLEIIVEGDDKMFNQYGVLVVNPEKNDQINNEGAILFADWLVSEAGQKAIGEFVEENSGKPLFIPNAKKSEEAVA